MANAVETAETYLAVPRAGAVAVCLNPDAGPAELEYMLGDCGARLIVTDAAHAELVAGLVPPDVPVVLVGGTAQRWPSYAELIGRDPDVPAPDPRRPRRHGVHALHLGHHRAPEGRGAEPAQLPVGGGGLLGADHGAGPGRHRAVRAAAVPLLRPGPVRARGRGHGSERTDPPPLLLDRVLELLATGDHDGPPRGPDDVLLPCSRGGRDAAGPRRTGSAVAVSAGAILPAAVNEAFERSFGVPCSTATGSPRPRRWS